VPHPFYIFFLFLLGACVGSFLNVVVWRLPRIIAPEGTPLWKRPWLVLHGLSEPPSHCPKCQNKLKWYDNVPIFGWIKLGGKCRFCREPISVRYPVVEAVTALLFVLYYVMYYMLDVGPCAPIPTRGTFADAAIGVYQAPEPPIFLLHLAMISALLAASLIDAELFIIPASIPMLLAVLGLSVHTLVDEPRMSGALNLVFADGSPSPAAALAAGGAVGLALSILLLHLGVFKQSFSEGAPLLDFERRALEADAALKSAGPDVPPTKPKKSAVAEEQPATADANPPREYEPAEIRAEMRKEMAFLLPPMMLAALRWYLTARVPAIASMWDSALSHNWLSGLLGSLFGGLIGGFVVWLTRILGSMGFGKEAMGLGDVDLMFGVGAIVGAGAATVAFFLAPFFGILTAIYLLITGKSRELPYGPYLGMASAAVLLCYCPIADWMAPGLSGLAMFVREAFGG